MPDAFDFRFSSEYFDSETSLVYYNFRYYSPELGRWMSREKLGEGASWNLYMHTKNSPTLYWDYLGLDPKWYQGGGSVDKFLTGLTGIDRVADGITETARESDPTISPVPKDRQYESTGSYGGVEFGFIGGAGFSFVECCDENNCRKRMYFIKFCVGAMVGPGISSGKVNLSGKTCNKGAYEKWFLEISYKLVGSDIGYDDSNWGLPGNPTGISEAGFSFSPLLPTPISGKWCYYIFDHEDILGCCKK
jgi:RHS repeat-associated protein